MTDSYERRCLAAHTMVAQAYPPYVNVSQFPNGDVEIIVRSMAVAHHSKKYQCSGSEAMVRLTARDFRALLADINREFRQ